MKNTYKKTYALNFDLNTVKIRDRLKSIGENESKYSVLYAKLKFYLESNGFKHEEGSMYKISDISTKEMNKKIDNLFKYYPWLLEYANKIELSVVGKQYDLLKDSTTDEFIYKKPRYIHYDLDTNKIKKDILDGNNKIWTNYKTNYSELNKKIEYNHAYNILKKYLRQNGFEDYQKSMLKSIPMNNEDIKIFTEKLFVDLPWLKEYATNIHLTTIMKTKNVLEKQKELLNYKEGLFVDFYKKYKIDDLKLVIECLSGKENLSVQDINEVSKKLENIDKESILKTNLADAILSDDTKLVEKIMDEINKTENNEKNKKNTIKEFDFAL